MRTAVKLTTLLVGFVLATSGAARADQVFRMAHDLGYGGAETMDPYDPNRFWPPINMVFDRLVGVDARFSPIPELATEWAPSADLKAWTLKLRPGVVFHDGSTFDAEDVVYSLKRMIDPEFDSPVRAVLGIISDVKAIDPLTVEIDLSVGEADLPVLLADYRALMTPTDSKATIGQQPIGTGPFKVEALDPEGTTVLAANERYFFGRPLLDRIEIAAISDSAARVQALLAGQIDMLLSVDAKQAPLFAGNPDFVSQRVPTGDWNAITMRVNEKPFDDPRIRKALRIAVDREALTRLVVGEGGGTVSCDTPVWPGDPYRWEGDCKRDVAGAKALLAEAGYPDGIDVEVFTSDVEENMVAIVEAYQAQAAEAGIRVKLTLSAASGFWDDVWMKKPMFVDSWGQRPAAQVLNEVYRSTASWNSTAYDNPAFDSLLDKARSEPDFEKRKAMYVDLQKLLFEDGGNFIPYHKNLLRIMRSNVKGIEPVVVDAIRWEKVSVQ